MHTYPGQESSSLSIGPYIAGKGYWVTPVVADDNNSRDAANFTIGVEAVIDRSVWLCWRMVNGLEGGTYPGDIAWNGSQTWNGAESHNGTEIHAGVVSFTNAAPVVFAHSLTASAGTTTLVALQVNGATTLSGGLALPSGSVAQVADKIVHVGTSGYEERRGTAGSASSVTINPWEQDLWVCPTLVAPCTWTLNHPPGNAVVETTVIFPSPSVGNTLALSDGGNIAVLGLGLYKSAVIIFDGTAWRVKASHT